ALFFYAPSSAQMSSPSLTSSRRETNGTEFFTWKGAGLFSAFFEHGRPPSFLTERHDSIVNSAAATITVRSNAEAGGSCPGATCTLRQAIATAAAGDTIDFDLAMVTSPISLSSGELAINKDLTISGPGANMLTLQRSTIGGTPQFGIFHIGGN